MPLSAEPVEPVLKWPLVRIVICQQMCLQVLIYSSFNQVLVYSSFNQVLSGFNQVLISVRNCLKIIKFFKMTHDDDDDDDDDDDYKVIPRTAVFLEPRLKSRLAFCDILMKP